MRTLHLMLLALAVLLASCGGGIAATTTTTTVGTTTAPTTTTAAATTTAGSPYSEDDPEYMLAAIDKGSFDVSDSEIAPYARVLDSLEPKCTESRSLIGDMAVVSVDLLADAGVYSETTLSMMEAVDLSIPEGLGEQRCADIYAALVTLVTSG